MLTPPKHGLRLRTHLLSTQLVDDSSGYLSKLTVVFGEMFQHMFKCI